MIIIILFYNTLFDENAACHIALGQCYSKCFKSKTNLSEAEVKAKGGNSSMIHIDWMIGSKEIDIHRLSDEWQHNEPGTIVVEGHLSHFLDVDAIIILRCNPKILQNRLEKPLPIYLMKKNKQNNRRQFLKNTSLSLLSAAVIPTIVKAEDSINSLSKKDSIFTYDGNIYKL